MKGKKIKRKCYYCGKVAKTTDHVPPKMLFPNHEKHRTNLITVPSCVKHNSNYNHLDTYFCYLISLSHDCNDIPEKYIVHKLKRAMTRDRKLKKLLLDNSEKILYNQNNIYQESAILDIKINYFNKEAIKIAKGLYYYEKNCIWKQKLNIYCNSMKYKKNNIIKDVPLFNKWKEYFTNNQNEYMFKGNNPEIFRYMFFESNNDEIILMQFYEGPVICAY